MTKKPRILITGATGFIGTYVLRLALEKEWDTYVAVRRESATRVLTGLPITRVEMDYADTEQMRHALTELPPMDYIVHMAGLTKALSAEAYMEVNAENTRRLLEAIEAQSHRPERFLLMSSMGSYGPVSGDKPLRADMPQKPNTLYGLSKLRAEQYLRSSSVPYTILCPTGVYGKGDEDYHISIDAMRKGVNFLSGTTPQKLSFVHVADVARAVFFLLRHPDAQGQTYLISDGKSYTDSDYTAIVSSLIHRPIREVRVPLPIIRLACRIGDYHGRLRHSPRLLNSDKYHILTQRNWHCDCSPLLELGFTPLYDLRSGLEEVLKDNL